MGFDRTAADALLRRIVTDIYAEIENDPDVQFVRICDADTGTYLVLAVGWDVTGRVLGPVVYVRIFNEKIYIEDNTTERDIVAELLAAPIDPAHIVRGYLRPDERELFGFAVA